MGKDKPEANINHMSQHAEREVSATHPGWTAYAWEAANNGAIVTGAVPVGAITRGPRKGSPVWPPRRDPTTQRIAVDAAVIVAQLLAREVETGVCADCEGTGYHARPLIPTATKTMGCPGATERATRPAAAEPTHRAAVAQWRRHE